MKQITAKGQTVNEAVESALKQLNTTREQVDIKIVQEAKKGFLGIFGNKLAIVQVELIEELSNEVEEKETILDEPSPTFGEADKQNSKDPVVETEAFLLDVVSKMGIEVKIDKIQQGKDVTFTLSGEKIAIIIGKRGQTLNSLQYLAQLVANRYTDQYINILLDAENYRAKRKETLTNLANRLAQKAVETGRDVHLEPMPSFERKIIHNAISSNYKVQTFSDGIEPNRHIVISPGKKRNK